MNNNGVLENNYGQNGRLSMTDIKYNNWFRYDAQLQGDKLLVAGMADMGIHASYRLKRFNAYGSEDLTFTGTSNVITNTRNAYDHSFYLGLQSQDKILLGGLAIATVRWIQYPLWLCALYL